MILMTMDSKVADERARDKAGGAMGLALREAEAAGARMAEVTETLQFDPRAPIAPGDFVGLLAASAKGRQ